MCNLAKTKSLISYDKMTLISISILAKHTKRQLLGKYFSSQNHVGRKRVVLLHIFSSLHNDVKMLMLNFTLLYIFLYFTGKNRRVICVP